MFLAVLLVSVMAAALVVVIAVLPAARRGPGPRDGGSPDRELGLYDVAFLAEGPARVVNVALVHMHETGQVHINSTGQVTWCGGESDGKSGIGHDHDDVHAAVHAFLHDRRGGTAHIARVRDEVKRAPAVQGIGDRLARDGLVLPAAGHRPREVLGTATTTLFFLCIPTAVVALVALPSPQSWLVAVGGIGAFLIPFFGGDSARLSPAGHTRLKQARGHSPWDASPETLLLGAVALGGLAAIESELLRDAMTQQQAHSAAAATSTTSATWCSSDAGGDSGGGGGGDGGCGGGSGCGSGCGGGCGGCGG